MKSRNARLFIVLCSLFFIFNSCDEDKKRGIRLEGEPVTPGVLLGVIKEAAYTANMYPNTDGPPRESATVGKAGCVGWAFGTNLVISNAHCATPTYINFAWNNYGDASYGTGSWDCPLLIDMSNSSSGQGYDFEITQCQQNASGEYPGDVNDILPIKLDIPPDGSDVHIVGYPDVPYGNMKTWSYGILAHYQCNTFADIQGCKQGTHGVLDYMGDMNMSYTAGTYNNSSGSPVFGGDPIDPDGSLPIIGLHHYGLWNKEANAGIRMDALVDEWFMGSQLRQIITEHFPLPMPPLGALKIEWNSISGTGDLTGNVKFRLCKKDVDSCVGSPASDYRDYILKTQSAYGSTDPKGFLIDGQKRIGFYVLGEQIRSIPTFHLKIPNGSTWNVENLKVKMTTHSPSWNTIIDESNLTVGDDPLTWVNGALDGASSDSVTINSASERYMGYNSGSGSIKLGNYDGDPSGSSVKWESGVRFNMPSITSVSSAVLRLPTLPHQWPDIDTEVIKVWASPTTLSSLPDNVHNHPKGTNSATYTLSSSQGTSSGAPDVDIDITYIFNEMLTNGYDTILLNYENLINDGDTGSKRFIGVSVTYEESTGPPPDPYCGDGTCNGTEDCSTCSADCGCCPPVCGDGTCEGDENCSNCTTDCGCGTGESCQSGICVVDPYCGDGACNGTEDCSTCSVDCGACQYCGDGTCDPNENCSNCESDCGACSGCRQSGDHCNWSNQCCSNWCDIFKNTCS